MHVCMHKYTSHQTQRGPERLHQRHVYIHTHPSNTDRARKGAPKALHACIHTYIHTHIHMKYREDQKDFAKDLHAYMHTLTHMIHRNGQKG
jgi:hypothetical protein